MTERRAETGAAVRAETHAGMRVIERAANDPDLSGLIAACLAGDQTGYAAIYERYAPSLYRLAYSLLLVEQDAEDVLQDAMVYALRNLDKYDAERASFRTWLYTITVSRCRNARRRKWLPTVALGHLLNLGLEPSAPADEGPEARALWQDMRASLAEALGTLSPRLREAVVLRYGQGLTYREMATILDIPQKTAESRVRLAHEQLRQVMSAADPALLDDVQRLMASE